MIGDLVAMKYFEKKDWKTSLTYSGLAMIASAILGIVVAAVGMPVLGLVASVAARYVVLKYILVYPKKRIVRVIALATVIDAIVFGVLFMVFGAALIALFGALAFSTPRETLAIVL